MKIFSKEKNPTKLIIIKNNGERKTLTSPPKKYNGLHGKEAYVYIGRVPCNMKHQEYELSPNPKTNEYGEYKKITIKIKRTFFNGKTVLIEPMPLNDYGILRKFNLNEDEISQLKIL